MFRVLGYVISDSGKYSGFGYPDIRIPVEITAYEPFPLAVLKGIVFRSVSDCSEATVYILCQSNWHVYISTNFQNVSKPSTLHSYLQNKVLGRISRKVLARSQAQT